MSERSRWQDGRAAVATAVLTLAAATGCAGGAAGETVAAPSTTSAGDPRAATPGSPGGSTVAGSAVPAVGPVITTVTHAWDTMNWTLYNHHPRVNAAAGRYQFDCVGMTNYFLSVAAPTANDDLRETEGVPDHYVPRPDRVLDFIRGLPAAGTATWLPVLALSDIQAGDLLAFGSRGKDVGHAAIAAGPPVMLADGSHSLLIYDSTGLVHGPLDTRNWDDRAQPGGSHPHTGLGRGTVRLTGTDPQDWSMYWTITSTRAYGDGVAVARPLA